MLGIFAMSGTKLKELRKRRGWTQVEAGKKLGIMARQWIRWEQRGLLSEKNLHALASLFEVAPKDFAAYLASQGTEKLEASRTTLEQILFDLAFFYGLQQEAAKHGESVR